MKKLRFPLCLLLLVPLVATAETELPVPVRKALDFRSVPDSALSVYIENLHTGEVILSWNAVEPRNPASVEKMVTTLVALDTLGPAYRWKTEISFLGEVKDGVLQGDLALKGFGDPYLVTERFWQMLRQIRLSGVTRIAGDLLIDDSYFDIGDYDPAAFDAEPLRAYNVAPNALLSNFKVVRYYFEPDPLSDRVLVRTDPQLENLSLKNKLTIRNGACRGYQRGVTISPNEDVSEITLSGRFPSGCDVYAMNRAVLGHNAFTYGLFRSLWQESGGKLEGTWKNIVLDDTLLPSLVFESLPLAEIITKINKHSNNVMARQLLYTLGAEKYGPAGSEDKGRQVIEEWMTERGLNSAELNLDNGAGLSRDSRMTAMHLGAILRFAYESPYMPEYLSSLSLSGLDGTMSRRFQAKRLTGQAHMKTGSLDHVSTIAGYYQAESGSRYIVVALINHADIHRGAGEEVQEMLLRWLHDR